MRAHINHMRTCCPVAVSRHVHGNSHGHVHGYVYADTCIDVGSYAPGVSWFGKTMEQVATGKY